MFPIYCCLRLNNRNISPIESSSPQTLFSEMFMCCECLYFTTGFSNNGIYFVFIWTVCVFVFPATDLINNLLQVKMRKRYSVDKSLSHVYLQVAHRHDSYAHAHTHTLFNAWFRLFLITLPAAFVPLFKVQEAARCADILHIFTFFSFFFTSANRFNIYFVWKI